MISSEFNHNLIQLYLKLLTICCKALKIMPFDIASISLFKNPFRLPFDIASFQANYK